MQKILLVEDDVSLISGLMFTLERQGYEVENKKTKNEAMEAFEDGKYQLVILDVSLPDGTGFEVCRKIRQISCVPIIFLTASDEETDMIMGLDIGGDDYITKPFKLAVLFSRINALLRRTSQLEKKSSELYSNGIRMLLLQGKVYKGEHQLELTAGEYKLLHYLMEHEGMILSAEQILSLLWDCEGKFVDNNTLSVYIRRLRLKVEDDPGKPQRIITVRGMGYKWNPGDSL